MNHAGVYSNVLAYLRAATAEYSASGARVVARMAATPGDDPLFGATTIRRDGRAVYGMHLFTVKAPRERQGPSGLLQTRPHHPRGQAFRPMSEGGCPCAR